MWRFVFALAITATVIWEVSSTGEECSLNGSPEDDSSYSDSDSQSCENDYTPKCKNPNEVYDPCDAPCPARRCDFNAAVVRCAAPPKVGDSSCVVGCRCIDGYLKDYRGVCIPANKCPKKCLKPNEVYDLCPATCPFRTCGIDDRLVDCSPSLPRPGDPNCPKPACRCKDQTFRDDKGNCVPWEKCPKCKKPNEVYDPCDAPCPARRCDFNAAVVRCAAPPKVGDSSCVVGCRCIDGYLRDYRGVCIPENKCPKCTKPNEVYDPCPDCSPQTCKTKDDKFHCPMIPANKTGPNCKPTCRCIPGYFRNLNGECILASDCDKCPAEHEFFSCGSACDNVCATLGKPCPIVNIKCTERCYCEDGYARATNDTCILVKDCKDDCKVNEVYSYCPAGSCAPLTCAKAGFPIKCIKYSQCPGDPGCICKDGYLRNGKGKCIPSTDCLSCGGDENAYPGCGNNCGQKCSEIGKNITICPLFCSINGCNCRENYYYDANRQKCVPACDCTPTCKENEEFSNCANGLCSPQECKDKGQKFHCAPMLPGSCVPGCLCKSKYLRKNGICVPEDECDPTPVCRSDEELSTCSNALCRHQDCKDKGQPVACPSVTQCIEGCVCPEGTLRAANGICVPEKQCPITPYLCTKANHEVYSTCTNGGGVPRTCSQKGLPCPDIDVANCERGCVCEDSYLRDDNGDCIPSEQCPTPECRSDEELSTCANGLNRRQKCTEKGKPFVCPSVTQCKKGCVCPKGTLRDANNTCIKEDKCPHICPEGEVYSNCPPTKRDAEYCPKNRNSVQSYPTPKTCGKGRCVCGFNSHRDRQTGKCIRTSDCPPFACSRGHEKYDSCPSTCPDSNCVDYLKNVTCPNPRFKKLFIVACKPACRCQKGYYRNKNRKCVTAKQCQPPTPPNNCDKVEILQPTGSCR